MRAHILGTLLAPTVTFGLVATVLVATRADDAGERSGPDRAAPVVAPEKAGVRGVETSLAAAGLPPGGGQTEVVRPGRFTHVAVTWKGTAPHVEVTTRTSGGGWSGWRHLDELDDLDLNEGDGTRGTQLLTVDSSDAVRVRVSGGKARDLQVVTIDPGATDPGTTDPGTTDPGTTGTVALSSGGAAQAVALSTASPVAASTSTAPVSLDDPLPTPPPYTPPSRYAPHPAVHSRAEWGANESLRKGPAEYNRTIRQVHVHHTVSSNSYTKESVPKLIRGMYWYHTQSLGWNDLGYNFLIDRFGRLWRGRAGGGIDAPVRGAHTLGFNHSSVGVSVIGNFEQGAPSRYALTALVRFAAWKTDYWRLRPSGWTYVVSEGSDKYPAGTKAYLPVIDGHRHTNDTACPGRYLFAKLPEVRTRAQQRADYF